MAITNNFNFDVNQKRESKTNPDAMSFGVMSQNRITGNFLTGSKGSKSNKSNSRPSSKDPSIASNRENPSLASNRESGSSVNSCHND